MIRITKMLGGWLLASALVACGGGGGSDPPAAADGGGGGGSTPTTATATMSLSIVNAAGTEVSNIDSSGGFQARATLRNASGGAEANRLVTFSLPDASLATLNPATALTDASGQAQVAIAPSSLTALGAATLTASAVVGTTTVTVTRDFGVSASNLALSAVEAGSTSLGSGGNTSLTVTALVNNMPATAIPVNVTFSATCGRINSQASSVSTTTSGNGVASATYTAVNADGSLCSGPVTVTASAAGAAPRSVSLNVAAPQANAITFVQANPPQIFIQGSGAAEQSLVTFRVLAGTTPMANQAVTFNLQVNPGGVGLGASGLTAPVTATTDAQGNVSVSVFSGTIPGPVRVRATLAADANVFAESQNLTVASGPPSQRFMSLSVQTFNIEGATLDGTATRLTVRLADRQGNPVADGTVVNFTAEGGQVASSCATLQLNGISSCSVDFVSQNPRPADGRVAVLAFTNGTKDFVDANGNNRFDSGETLVAIGDAYRDDNENAAFDIGEFVVPRGGASACASTGAPFPSRADSCDAELATTVRQQTTILYSSSSPVVAGLTESTGSVSFSLGSSSNPLLPMPAGTAITATTRDATAANDQSCAVASVVNSTVPNVAPGTDPSANLNTFHQVLLTGCGLGDTVTITITSPSGLATSFTSDLQ